MLKRTMKRSGLIAGTVAAAGVAALTLGVGAASADSDSYNTPDGFTISGAYYWNNYPYFLIDLCNHQSSRNDFNVRVVDTSNGQVVAETNGIWVDAGGCSGWIAEADANFGDPMSAQGSGNGIWYGTDAIMPS